MTKQVKDATAKGSTGGQRRSTSLRFASPPQRLFPLFCMGSAIIYSVTFFRQPASCPLYVRVCSFAPGIDVLVRRTKFSDVSRADFEAQSSTEYRKNGLRTTIKRNEMLHRVRRVQRLTHGTKQKNENVELKSRERERK